MSTNMNLASLRRRDFLYGLGSSLGAVAMTDLLAKETVGPLVPKKPMHTPKAKAVIMLFMEGGPSQVDTFDPKPILTKLHGQPLPQKNFRTERRTGHAMGSPYAFKRYGQSGLPVRSSESPISECTRSIACAWKKRTVDGVRS